jgi:nucleoside-diphosphate-sugar epimerase
MINEAHSGQQVLVTGATGFLGGALARRLAADGARVRVLVRSPQKAASLRQQGIEIVQGDLNSPDALRRACADCAVVFHVAAALSGSYAAQYAANVEGTRMLLAAATNAGVQRFVHVSSISVYGYRVKGEITEATTPAPGADPYPQTKTEAEAVVRDGSLPFTIIRPAMIYGAAAVNWTGNLFRLAKLKPTPFVGSGQGSSFPIHVDDVVDLMVTAAEHPAAIGETFNCAPDPAPTWRKFLGHYARLAGHDRWLALPPVAFAALARGISIISPSNSRLRDLPDQVGFLQRSTTYKMTKAHDLLGWSPRVPLDDGIAGCADWLREQGWLR